MHESGLPAAFGPAHRRGNERAHVTQSTLLARLGCHRHRYSRLFLLNELRPHGGIITDAATAVPTMANGGISRDGKRIVFHVRRDIKWQDDYPLTARDVVFSYRAIMNPSNAVTSRSGYTYRKEFLRVIRTRSSWSYHGHMRQS